MPLPNWLEQKLSPLLARVPLVVWVLTAVVGILIPFKILSVGYLPVDDVMSYVAKALSGKPWPEILVMDERFAHEEHPGWISILTWAHQVLHLDADALVAFSIAMPFVLYWLVILFSFKRPEAMLLAILGGTVLATSAFSRLLFGRPLDLVMVVYLILLRLWTRPGKISTATHVASVLLIGFSVWVHGAWYFFAIVVSGFVLANEWCKAVRLGFCWVLGSLLGAALTGEPLGYLFETFTHMLSCFGVGGPGWMMVYELRPQYSDLFLVLILLALVWRVARGEWQTAKVWTPPLALAVMCWVLGFKVVRFWTDWGFPAAVFWLAGELDEFLSAKLPAQSWRSLILAVMAAAAVYFSETSDVNSRWSSTVNTPFITPTTPGIDGWLPEPGGIVYSPDMTLFDTMFYKNPTADWRYALGFEPGIMTPENLTIYRSIQRKGSVANFELWVAKMRPEDRMIIEQDSQPPIPGLEWHFATEGRWIGRLSRTNASPGSAGSTQH